MEPPTENLSWIFLIATPILAALLTTLALPKWIQLCKNTGLLWEDMNKPFTPKTIAACGGVIVIPAFLITLLTQTLLNSPQTESLLQTLALTLTLTILTLTGLTDDLLDWKKGGLSIRTRILLAFFASLPLIIIKAGTHTITLPLLGTLNLGWIYPLVLIPIGIAGATCCFNLLAGFNGLEGGQALIILAFLSLVGINTQQPQLTLIPLTMIGALLPFLYFNRFPAQIFPGDSLTWPLGGLIAALCILGNFERVGLFMFLPFLIETLLKLRGHLKKQSFGKPNSDGTLSLPYPEIYSLTHLAILLLQKTHGKATEPLVVRILLLFQTLICCLSLALLQRF